MQPSVPPEARSLAAPSFHLIGRQRLGAGAILLGTLAAAGVLASVVYAMDHARHAALAGGSGASRSAGAAGDSKHDDDDDDPNQIDTIVLGDPGDAPVPARKDNHVSPVHATIVVRLPRYGDQTGLIPNSPVGHLLYGWLAAFNQTNAAGLGEALPTVAPGPATAFQLELRKQTGGFNLLSAKEVQPGVLVFRLRDQTPEGNEALGTLQMRPGSEPAAIASFSMRSVPSPRRAGTPPSS
ncbi:hypothetical protein SAMN05421770_101517 [Granulicella rosea]|uniref:Uncharacterized protein n=1 Tax=Granulicella rosea TaxID=474952 RepID=A0A239DKU0_9BACT|nr:hypothetical protein [Granulicella rosea]SNS32819.1 hypothetical protein SAMN05421770_101517 [Granulicella rosea]